MSDQQPNAEQVMEAMLTGIYATSMATVKAVQESQSEAFGESRDITLAGGLAATAAQAAAATRDLTLAYATLKGLDAPAAPAA